MSMEADGLVEASSLLLRRLSWLQRRRGRYDFRLSWSAAQQLLLPPPERVTLDDMMRFPELCAALVALVARNLAADAVGALQRLLELQPPLEELDLSYDNRTPEAVQDLASAFHVPGWPESAIDRLGRQPLTDLVVL